MNQPSLVIKLLEEVFPDECDIAGPANVRRLAARTNESVRVDGGSNLDVAQVLNELQSVVVILFGTLSILQSLSRSSGHPVGIAEAKELVEREIPEFSNLDPRKRDAILDHMYEWINADPESRTPWISH